MSDFTQGRITIDVPENLTLPEEAGHMTSAEVRRLPKARKNVSLVCDTVAESMRKNPDRICPYGITADQVEASGRVVDLINSLGTDLAETMGVIAQSDVILSAEAHDNLRKVLAFVRGQEKFDPRLGHLVPELIEYFSRRSSGQTETDSAEDTVSVAA